MCGLAPWQDGARLLTTSCQQLRIVRMVHNRRTYVDLYCERLAPGLLGEPLNTLSNAAFFIAAWLVARDARGLRAMRADIVVLAALTVVVGIGSTAFHMLATTWANWLDLVPILVFQLAFLWIYARRELRWTPIASALLVSAFLAVALYARGFPEPFNGSITYAPALVAICALGLHHRATHPRERPLLLAAAGVFTGSLFLRTIDAAACERFPLGTHFCWHLLNGVVLYLAVRSLLRTAE
jgi:Ceramidase